MTSGEAARLAVEWSEAAGALLPPPPLSADEACAALHAALDPQRAPAAALHGVQQLAEWAEARRAQWLEPYVMAFLPSVLALCADKQRAVQLAAEAAGRAMMRALHPVAVDGALPLLCAEFDAHRWQTKLAALAMLTAMAEASPAAVGANLATLVVKLMEVAQDPKPSIKQAATRALRQCCAVITNPDVSPLIDAVIAANLDPSLADGAVDQLVATPFVHPVDEQTLALLVPLLLRALRARAAAATIRKAALVVDTMLKLATSAAAVAPIAAELRAELARDAAEVALPEVRQKVGEALATLDAAGVPSAGGGGGGGGVSAAEVEALLRRVAPPCGGAAPPVFAWVARVSAPHFGRGAPLDAAVVEAYLRASLSAADASAVAERFLSEGALLFGVETDAAEEEQDDLEVLCDCDFSLAYGNRVLLHSTPLKLKRGKCYGLIGPNGAGKSTLMRSIALGTLEGFPQGIRSVYVECDVSAADGEVSCIDFALADPDLKASSKEEVAAMLRSVGFSERLMDQPVGALSGGWRMRFALSRAMLRQPELLLLDEPTNHIDAHGVEWLTRYLQNLSDQSISSMIVSHDSAFLDAVAQAIVHFEKTRKLKVYQGNLSAFVQRMPEAAAYYRLESQTVAFSFPSPGPLEGVTSRTKAIVKLTNASFTYAAASLPALVEVSAQLSMASRVAVVGPNGAGKSTLIKLLVGELLLEEGAGRLEKHPNMRLAYVAQHAFHHIERHLDKSPAAYLEWRFSGGVDAEGPALNFLTLDEDEAKLVGQKKGQVEKLVGRRKSKKGVEYEVQLVGCADPMYDNEWVSREELLQRTWTDPDDKKKRKRECGSAMAKLIAQADERCAFQQSGISEKKLTAADVQAHFDQFNLEAQFGTHAKISALSGGQKVKVVLAAAMWMEPHVLILDEPTNFLDRDSLGALTCAVKAFGGGVVVVSHQREFYSAVCTEIWTMDGGRCTVTGSDWWDGFEKARKKEAEKAVKEAAKADKEDKKPGTVSKIELKKIKKKVADMRKNGEDVNTDDEIQKAGYALDVN
ncbi:hypothetical protein AB1Y20_007851 [Prymnesium parvum]|uniref:ABC transporter domain-containing protein n=1 Tax=Prymnesium parvum TaxID=97485 RepID=A0AB34IT28_PRYPA